MPRLPISKLILNLFPSTTLFRSTSLDLFSFPWWRYRISKPSHGVDAQVRATYQPRLPFDAEVSYRFKKKERDVAGTSGAEILPTYQHRFRMKFNYIPCEWIALRTVADYNRFVMQAAHHGYQFSQMIRFNAPATKLTLQLQGSYFDTDNYDTRLYLSARNMLHTVYIPSFYGEGFRWSGYIRYDLNKHWMAMGKVGQTIYRDRTTIGTGSDQINSNRKADVEMLLRIKF